MGAKYQVFVSSTYEDLKAEREQVVKAILEMGHIPVGMEMFSAGDEDQWKVIAKKIDECDYYAIIVARRYGSVTSEGISYTEKEYDYATDQEIPTIGFILDGSASWPGDRDEHDRDKIPALDAFKAKVKRKMVKHWTSTEDLYGKFSISLMTLINTNPRVGWVRATETAGPEVANEITRLSSENAKLTRQLNKALHSEEKAATDKDEKLLRLLRASTEPIHLRYVGQNQWGKVGESTLAAIFGDLAAHMNPEISCHEATRIIAGTHADHTKKVKNATWLLPRNTFFKWMADFTVLGLMALSDQPHEPDDKRTFWILTEAGREFYAYVRCRELEATLRRKTKKVKNPKS